MWNSWDIRGISGTIGFLGTSCRANAFHKYIIKIHQNLNTMYSYVSQIKTEIQLIPVEDTNYQHKDPRSICYHDIKGLRSWVAHVLETNKCFGENLKDSNRIFTANISEATLFSHYGILAQAAATSFTELD